MTTALKTPDDMAALWKAAEARGDVRRARKTRPVDARPAKAGEIVVTVLKGEGEETRNTAKAGDWVVRNRCDATGNEEYIVAGAKFTMKYKKAGDAAPLDAGGWQEFHPEGKPAQFFFLQPADGTFSFVAPWGETLVARPSDAILRNPDDAQDVYRVARASFDCTYEVLE
jgi:hypothetical protein